MFTNTVLTCICYLVPWFLTDYWKWALKQVFFSFWSFCCIITPIYGITVLWKIKKIRKNRNKLRTIYPENHESFKNSKPTIQFYWVLLKKSLAGAVISQKIVISIRTGFLKGNNPNSLSEFGGSVILTLRKRGVLQSMDWVKRKETSGKKEPSKQLFNRRTIYISDVYLKSFLWASYTIRVDHQTLLSDISTGKYTINIKDAENIPVKRIDDKRQIASTFAVSTVGDFLPMQLISTGNTKRCLPNFDFPHDFNVSFTKNHWSNI